MSVVLVLLVGSVTVASVGCRSGIVVCLELVQLVQNLLFDPLELLILQRYIIIVIVVVVIAAAIIVIIIGNVAATAAASSPGEQLPAATRSAVPPVSPLVQQAVVQLGLQDVDVRLVIVVLVVRHTVYIQSN